MGNDGGSIPTRRELVKEAARNPSATEIKESQHEQQEYHWTTDPISQEPLRPPIVSDASGKLYNKATILEYLVEAKRKEDVARVIEGGLKSLKDLVEVKFEADESEVETRGSKGGAAGARWKCPVTGDKLGPGSKAVYLVPCGHAFSGSAIKEVSGEKCFTCETAYVSNDIIPIIPTAPTDIARLSLRMKTLQEKGLSHSLKKASGGKKRKQKEYEAAATSAAEQEGMQRQQASGGGATKSREPRMTMEAEVVPGSNGINNASTASLTARVLQEQERAKKRRLDNENVRSLFAPNGGSTPSSLKKNDFMTRGYSVPAHHHQSAKR